MNLICIRCIPKWIAAVCAIAFAFSGWAGWTLFNVAKPHIEPPPPPIEKVKFTLRFVGFDVQGNPIKGGTVEGLNGEKPQSLGPLCESTPTYGTSKILWFAYNSHRRKEQVTWKWQSADEYKAWLRAELPKKFADMHQYYDSSRWNSVIENDLRIAGAKGDYPVVFSALSPTTQGSPGPNGQ